MSPKKSSKSRSRSTSSSRSPNASSRKKPTTKRAAFSSTSRSPPARASSARLSKVVMEEKAPVATKPVATKQSGKKQTGSTELSLYRTPLEIFNYFMLFCVDELLSLYRRLTKKPTPLISVLVVIALFAAINIIDGPHQVWLKPLQKMILWYGRWFMLGVFSSIGLGSGAHTFLLFLGPLIARATTAAYICKTTGFAMIGVGKMTCPNEPYVRGAVTILSVFVKTFPEVFAWGLGTAIGELPPYLIARACKMGMYRYS